MKLVPSANATMTNDWLKSQGLISVRDPWIKAHGYAREMLPFRELPSADLHAVVVGLGVETHGYPNSVALPVFGKNLNYLRRRMVT